MKIIQNSLLLLLLLAFALAGPIESSALESREKTCTLATDSWFFHSWFSSLEDNTLDFKHLLTSKTWRLPLKNEDRVYLQPADKAADEKQIHCRF